MWLGLSTSITAQITVTNATFPAVGDAVFYAIDANSNVIQVITPPGGSQNWDLSDLQVNQTGTTVYRNPNTGTQSASFPGADLLVVEMGREMYYNVTNNRVEYMGYYGSDPLGVGLNLLIRYNPPLDERRAPINFFDINAESSAILAGMPASEFPVNLLQLLPFTADSLRIRAATSRLNVVDGWGTLSIPGGCYQVLREKRTTYEEKRIDAKIQPLGWLDVTDVVFQSWGLTTPIVDTIIEYHFFSTVDKQEIAVVRLNTAGSAVEMVRFKYPDNSQFAIANIAASPESCPNANDGSITITATAGAGTLTYAISGPVNQSNNTGVFTSLPDGNYTVTVTSNISPCPVSGTATVAAGMDTQPPTITCPANQTLALGATCSASLPNYTGLATTGDNCGVLSVTQSPAAGTTVSGAGNMTVMLTVTDVNNLTNTCTFTVAKGDNTPPTITCPAAQILALGANCSATLPNYTGLATTGDNCGVQSVTQSPAAGTTVSGAGNTTVMLTVTDVNNLTNTCTFTVAKGDNTPPTITCPVAQILALGANCSATLPNYTGLATTGDNCGVQGVTQSPVAGTTVSGAGNMTVTLTVTDVNGLTNSCTFTVTKVDNTPPTVVCKNAPVFLGNTGAYTLQASDVFNATASSDNCSGALTVTNISPAVVNCSQLNQTIPVTVTVQDGSGNSATCVAQITVQEGTALPADWSSNNVGNANGSAGYKACSSNGSFTVTASGFSTASSDVLHLASRSLCGNGEIIARVLNVQSGGWAGVTLRESLAPGSKKVALKTQLTSIVRREIRNATNGPASILNFNRPAHVWLRLVRSGSNFIGYTSIDGQNWTFAFSANVPMVGCIYAGLFAESINANVETTASFDNVTVLGGTQNLGSPQQGVVPALDGLSVSVFPNPSNGALTLSVAGAPERNLQLEVMDMMGKMVRNIALPEGSVFTYPLDLSDQPAGVYFLRLRSENGVENVQRIVVQH